MDPVPAQAILLDLDRTLVDLQSFTDYAAALADVRALVGSWADADVPETDWDRPTQACMAVLHSLRGDPRWQAVSDAMARQERSAIPRSTPMPTLADALAAIGPVPAAVVTLLPADVAAAALAAHGVRVGPGAAIDLVVGRDPRVPPKPQPDGLVLACSRLEVRTMDAVMIGDSTWDEEAARAAGAAFIGVPGAPGASPPGAVTAATLAEAVHAALGG